MSFPSSDRGGFAQPAFIQGSMQTVGDARPNPENVRAAGGRADTDVEQLEQKHELLGWRSHL